jgi:exodeoxyribonuclease VII large subunit
MDQELLSLLRQWRDRQARTEGVEVFRVFPNAVLDTVARTLPRTRDDLLAIKGIKEAKYAKYGATLLALVRERISETESENVGIFPETCVDAMAVEPIVDETMTVSQFLDGLNTELSGMAARIRGEISSVDERERVVYFSLKDSLDEGMIQCLIFRYAYEVSGVKLSVGDEVIIEGVPEIYKPNGRMSFKAGIIELAGEGALKKAYDALKAKLESEGVFAPEHKRELPDFPKRVALITSHDGAAIGDFTMNLGSQGLSVHFFPVSVEGKRAVFEMVAALRFFQRHAEEYDMLVIIRGGGSFESLQAFNNETLIREIAGSAIPTLLGVGHEKDVTLAALAADMMVSTPTAAARTIREPFDRARQSVGYAQTLIVERFSRSLSRSDFLISRMKDVVASVFPKITGRFATAERGLGYLLEQVRSSVRSIEERYKDREKRMQRGFMLVFESCKRDVGRFEEKLREYDPYRALNLGYGLVRSQKKLIRKIADVQIGAHLDIQVGDGIIGAEVKGIKRL